MSAARTYVVALPAFSDHDREIIDAIRNRFDRLAGAIPPHVTLVFATERLDASGLAAHASTSMATAPFTCVLRRTHVEHDPFNDEHCVFLVVDEGARQIVELHDALYSGPLAPELRTDLPYLPHVTIARCPTSADARQVAAMVGDVRMRARIDHVRILVGASGAFTFADTIAL